MSLEYEKIIRLIKKKINQNRRKRNRYWSEVEEITKGKITKRDISQLSYSYAKSNQHLAICDELKELIKDIKRIK